MKRTIYEAVYDGMFSEVQEILPHDEAYRRAAEAIANHEDEDVYFYSRRKAVAAVRKMIKRRIADLRGCLKRLNEPKR